MEKNRAVLYLRLSKEDADKLRNGDDSASIKNQRLLLLDYASINNFHVVEIYSDDDESGLYNDRPDFVRMMEDAKNGMFDVIIAKTQARFSRNMEHIERYLHHELPNMGIRFIGVVDGVDTKDIFNKKSRQINGLVNEWYCEDLSMNIRSAFKAKMKDGQFLGSFCAYGYKKDLKNHNHLVIDDYAAGIVRRIFDLYLQGYGKQRIGAILSSEGVLIPTRYKQEILKTKYSNSRILDTTKCWSYQTIHTILNNQVYIGHLVQNKANTLSYKDRKVKALPKSKWIIVENAHEPIIDRDTWERVQQLQKVKTRSVRAESEKGIFSGLIFCADCKHAMARQYERRGNHNFIGYVCKTYKTQGKKFCSSHSIDYEVLEEAVLSSMKEESGEILCEKDIEELKRIRVFDDKKRCMDIELDQIEKERKKYEKFKQKSFESYIEEVITKDEYIKYSLKCEEKIQGLTRNKEKLMEQIKIQDEWNHQQDEWIERFINYIDVQTLTREIVVELIDRIEVHEDGSIDLYYRFGNP